MRSSRRPDGFTLLEIAMGLLIVGVLSLAGVVIYHNYTARAQATEIVEKYDALRAGAGVALAEEQNASCEEVARRMGDANLKDKHARLAYGFEAVPGGYRPVLTVCATADSNGKAGVKVARGAHDNMVRTGRVEKGAVLTDSVVSFAMPLTDGNRVACTVAPASPATACGGPTTPAAVATPAADPAKAMAAAFNPQAAQLPSGVKTIDPAATSCPAGQEFATVTAGGATQRACAPTCKAGERRTPTGACVANVPPVQPGWVAQANPPVPIVLPPTPAPGQAPTCAAGKEIVATFVGGILQNICVDSCPQGQVLGLDWKCVADPQGGNSQSAPTATAPATPCIDSFLGDCTVDFNGMCDMDFVQEYCAKTCGLCDASGNVITSATKQGSNPQAPVVPTRGVNVPGVLPKVVGESVVLDGDTLVVALGAGSPDGRSPVRITGIDFGGTEQFSRDGKTTPYTAVQQADGRWRVTLTSRLKDDLASGRTYAFYAAKITVDNGLGTNTVQARMTQP